MSGKHFRTVEFSQTVENYRAISTAFSHAFREMLEALAATHDNQLGSWFDELEKRLIRDTKNIVGEGVSIEVEAATIKVALDVLQAHIDVVRHNLSGADDN